MMPEIFLSRCCRHMNWKAVFAVMTISQVEVANHELHYNTKKDETVLRLSKDAKASVLVGPYSIGGSDFIADCLQDFRGTANQRFPEVSTLLINLDNGPENSSKRTQFMKRLTQFADEFKISVQLAYYPPYHRKYNPVELGWGILNRRKWGFLDRR